MQRAYRAPCRVVRIVIPDVSQKSSMSPTLEPREVEKPFPRRWLRMTLELFVRSPLRFGVVIALLGGLDHAAVALAQASGFQREWTDRLGTVVLPFVWILTSALARGADDPRQSSAALAVLGRKRAWLGALRAGATLAVFLWIAFWVLQGVGELLSQHRPEGYLNHPAELLASIVANVLFLQSWVGVCYCPLLVLQPQLSAGEASHLSRRASKLNGNTLIIVLFGAITFGAVSLSSVLPFYGMTDAALLVFLGVLNYVAYRDIFERRTGTCPRRPRQRMSAKSPKRVVEQLALSNVLDSCWADCARTVMPGSGRSRGSALGRKHFTPNG